MLDADPPSFPAGPEDDQDADISVGESLEVAGQEIQEGQIVARPNPDDEVNLDGALLKVDRCLAALCAGCSFYSLSSNGSKRKCFERLLNHSQKSELDMGLAAAKESQRQHQRDPLAPIPADAPAEFEQAKHRLTHLPFASWCPFCLAHRANHDVDPWWCDRDCHTRIINFWLRCGWT